MEDTASVSFVPATGSFDEVEALVIPDSYASDPLAEKLKATRIVVEEIGQSSVMSGDQGSAPRVSVRSGRWPLRRP